MNGLRWILVTIRINEFLSMVSAVQALIRIYFVVATNNRTFIVIIERLSGVVVISLINRLIIVKMMQIIFRLLCVLSLHTESHLRA